MWGKVGTSGDPAPRLVQSCPEPLQVAPSTAQGGFVLPELRQRTQGAEIGVRCSPERPHTYFRVSNHSLRVPWAGKGHPGHAFGVTEVVGASSPRAFCQAGGFIPPALPETRR